MYRGRYVPVPAKDVVFGGTGAVCQTHTRGIPLDSPMHPDIHEHALSLLRDLVPLTWLQQLCCDWAKKRWGDAAGNDFYRYVLQDYDSTSMYWTLLSMSGLHQRSSAE